ncbi:MAG: hypothetical protein H3Z50_08270 [archaeon]|nr:hypothetical protein [archaeon]
MCGIIGIINAGAFSRPAAGKQGYRIYPEEDMLDGLFTVSALRGRDSSGLFAAKDKEVITYKKVMDPSDFIFTEKYKALRRDYVMPKTTIIGHTRAATSGGITINAAHPHQDGRVTLVHNGTLTGWKNLVKQNAVSDSQAIAMCLNQNADDYVKALEKLDGAYALIWHDAETGMIHFAKNNQRPLAYLRKDGTFLVASEAIFTDFVAARIGTKMESIERKEFENGKLYSLVPGEETMSEVPFKPYVYQAKKCGSYNSGGGYNYNYNSDHSKERKAMKKFLTKLENQYSLDVSRDKKIWIRPIDCEVYRSSGRGTNQGRGTLYGFVQANGKDVEELGALSFGVENVKELTECDLILAQSDGLSKNYAGSQSMGLFPKAQFKATLKATSIEGYVYANANIAHTGSADALVQSKELIPLKDTTSSALVIVH